MEQDTGYDGDDGGSEDESSSLNVDQHAEENYMSLDESYSGNVDNDDGIEDMDIDDSYAESASQMDAVRDYERNTVHDDIDQSDFDAFYDDSSSKVSCRTCWSLGGP